MQPGRRDVTERGSSRPFLPRLRLDNGARENPYGLGLVQSSYVFEAKRGRGLHLDHRQVEKERDGGKLKKGLLNEFVTSV